MAQQTINIGAAPNDGTGTPLRTSFDYTNQNFTEIYTALGGGVGLPGATTQVIFNDGGTNLAGDAGLTYNKTTDALTLLGAMTMASSNVTGGTIPANGVYLPAANTLEFAANSLAQYRIAPLGVFSWYDGAGGTRMTLNSTGLGVGVTPDFKLVVNGTQAIPASSGSATDNGSFRIGAPGTGLVIDSGVYAAGPYYAWIQVRARSNYANTYDLALQPTGGNLLVGTLTANANGGVLQLKSGITFPATQVAATDVNTLDDYAETNFTPTIDGSTTAGTATYSSATGRATKVGRLVTFSLRVIYSAGTGTGNLRVGGLPYTVGYASVCAVYAENIALTASYYPVATAQVSNTTIAIEQLPTGGGAAASVPYDAAGDITISGSYIV
jgi:hypothetical protein